MQYLIRLYPTQRLWLRRRQRPSYTAGGSQRRRQTRPPVSCLAFKVTQFFVLAFQYRGLVSF
jgi:hypothetical protein